MKCTVPISAHFTVEGGKITSEEYKTSEMDASRIADLLIGEFGLEFEASTADGESPAAA